jgi:hypothetical protein
MTVQSQKALSQQVLILVQNEPPANAFRNDWPKISNSRFDV